MSYWESQYKHGEVARLQNKREDRLLQLEVESKRGIRDIHKLNMQAVKHEKRLVERELERIRRGMNKKPLQPTASGNIGYLALFGGSHVSARRSSRQENTPSTDKYAEEYMLATDRDSEQLRSIVPDQREPETFDYAREVTEPGVEFYPESDRALRRESNGSSLFKRQDDINGTEPSERTVRDIDLPVKEKQAKVDTYFDTVLKGADELDSGERSIARNISYWQGVAQQNDASDLESPRIKRRPQRTSLDITQLASLDMASVKSNVSRRLSKDSKRADVTLSNARDVKREDPVPEAIQSEEGELKVKEKTRKTSRTKATGLDAYKKTTDFDPEQYNPDGSLRRVHNMPSCDKSWEEARKARYIRCRDPQERERELSADEVFEKNGKC